MALLAKEANSAMDGFDEEGAASANWTLIPLPYRESFNCWSERRVIKNEGIKLIT
jgi:hypothetical protein